VRGTGDVSGADERTNLLAGAEAGMSTALGRRLARLETGRPRPSPFDVMAPIIAELSTAELRDLLGHGTAVREGQRPTPEQEAVHGKVRDLLALVGIVLP
jgi:hypothetical protein